MRLLQLYHDKQQRYASSLENGTWPNILQLWQRTNVWPIKWKNPMILNHISNVTNAVENFTLKMVYQFTQTRFTTSVVLVNGNQQLEQTWKYTWTQLMAEISWKRRRVKTPIYHNTHAKYVIKHSRLNLH